MMISCGEALADTEDAGIYFTGNFTCENAYLPNSVQLFESFGNFGKVLVTMGSIICAATVYFAIDACTNIFCKKDTRSFKFNTYVILSVYPVASLCSLLALAIPRSQLLAEALIQVSLTLALYRMFELLVELGQRATPKEPTLVFKVGPCCCWPCLQFPSLQMTERNLAWLRISVLQLPLVQGLIYCILLFMLAEAPILVFNYGVFLQPAVVISILLGIYGLTVVTRSWEDVAPEAKLRHKTMVSQMVLLFSKLQGFLIKSLVSTGLFPCNPPLTPRVYANVTYNTLMIIEMLLLCYAARLIYAENPNEEEDTADLQVQDRRPVQVQVIGTSCKYVDYSS